MVTMPPPAAFVAMTMRARLEHHLAGLKTDQAKIRLHLEQLAHQHALLQATLLRLEGAIGVLEELLAQKDC